MIWVLGRMRSNVGRETTENVKAYNPNRNITYYHKHYFSR